MKTDRLRFRILWLITLLFTLTAATVVLAQTEFVVVNYPATQENEESMRLNVFFTLTDGNGRSVPNANVNEASVQLFGSAAPVPARVEKPNTPFYVVLVLDASGSMADVMDDMKTAAAAAIDGAPPTARFAVIRFNEDIEVVQGFTDNPAFVKNAIATVETDNKGTCLYDATFRAIQLIDETVQSPEERRAVILFTDGQDQLTIDDPAPCSRETYQSVTDLARRRNAFTAVHTIGLAGDQNAINAPELRQLAADTGGFSAIGSIDQLGALFSEIIAGLNNQWVAIVDVFPKQGVNQAILAVETRDSDVPFTTTFDFFSSRNYDLPPPPVGVTVRSLQYDSVADQYALSLGLISPEEITRLVVTVWDARRGVQVTPEYAFDNPAANLTVTIDTDGFEAGREYQIRVNAVDEDGFFIPNPDGEIELVSDAEFEYEPFQAAPVTFLIESANADYETQSLAIDLQVSDISRVLSYEGFIVDAETGQRLADFGPGPLTGRQIIETLPPAIAAAPAEQDYRITIYLDTVDSGRLESVFDNFSPIPPAPPTFMERLTFGLQTNPTIVYSIVAIVVLVLVWMMIRSIVNRRSKGTPYLQRKGLRANRSSGELPIRQTMVDFSPMESGASAGMAVASEATVVMMPRVKLTVIETPNADDKVDVEISNFPYAIGREGCDLNILNDRHVSRRHAQVSFANGAAYFADLGSANGTYVNGQRLKPQEPIRLDEKQSSTVRLGTATRVRLEVVI